MNNELSLYKVWRKLCKKIINLDSKETEKKENEILHEICYENKNTINAIMSFYIKNNMRKIIKKRKDLC
jgi:hypothetical protein